MAKEFATWAYECWLPAVTEESPEADHEALKAVNHFKEAVKAIEEQQTN
jgi:hypothetical protein